MSLGSVNVSRYLIILLWSFLFLIDNSCCYPSYNSSALLKRERRVAEGFLTNIKNVPYIAQLYSSENTLCGASIISQYWLLTAAHCVYNKEGFYIMTGSSIRREGQRYEVKHVKIHEDYDNESYKNDIALIRVYNVITLSNVVNIITLSSVSPYYYQKNNMVGTVSGYGTTSLSGPFPPSLKYAKIPILSKIECDIIRGYSTQSSFCAGDGSADACLGDSGGPFMVDSKLVGIVSFGSGCGNGNKSVYTNVAYYIKWIMDTIRKTKRH